MNVESFVTERVAKMSDFEERRQRLAQRYTQRVQHAMGVLDSTPVGECVIFEGSCPSGATYEGETLWDGTDATRQAIAEKAMRLGGFDAWAAWLRRSNDVRQGVFVAKMRIS